MFLRAREFLRDVGFVKAHQKRKVHARLRVENGENVEQVLNLGFVVKHDVGEALHEALAFQELGKSEEFLVSQPLRPGRTSPARPEFQQQLGLARQPRRVVLREHGDELEAVVRG